MDFLANGLPSHSVGKWIFETKKEGVGLEQPQYRTYLQLLEHPEREERKAAAYALRAYAHGDPERSAEIIKDLSAALNRCHVPAQGSLTTEATESIALLRTLRCYRGKALAATVHAITMLLARLGSEGDLWSHKEEGSINGEALQTLDAIWICSDVPLTDTEIAVVARHVESQHDIVATWAVKILGSVGRQAAVYVPVIVQAAHRHEESQELLECVGYALRSIGPPLSPSPELADRLLALILLRDNIPDDLRRTVGDLLKQLMKPA